MFDGIFENIVYWHWWIFAVILFILEVFSPAAFFLWLGVAGVITGLATLIFPSMTWEIQFLIFSVFSIISVYVGRSWFKRDRIKSENPSLNERGNELVGRTFSAATAFKNGSGRIIVGESTWKAIGPDCPTGTPVKVIEMNGAVATVELV